MIRDLLDDDGENLAVRAFLLYYGGGNATCPIISMRTHLARSGFDGCWPEWARAPNSSTLTKAGAQLWIRHLFSLEVAAPTAGESSARTDGACNSALRAEPAGQHNARSTMLLEHEIGGIIRKWQATSNSFYDLCRAVEAELASRGRAQGGMHENKDCESKDFCATQGRKEGKP